MANLTAWCHLLSVRTDKI